MDGQFMRRGSSKYEYVNFVLEECCSCGVPFWLPYELQKKIIERGQQGTLCCPNGHKMVYSGPTEAQRLRKELEDHKRSCEATKAKLREEIAKREKLETILGRVDRQPITRPSKQPCPHCGKHYRYVKLHIKNKHKDKL